MQVCQIPPGASGPSPATCLPRRPAFTLVELLVVVSIIAMLVAILMPSLGKAKDITRLTLCRTNHHVLIQATRMYCEEWRGVLPFSNWLSQEDDRGNYDGPGWLYKYPDMTELKHLQAGQIWQYVGDVEAYRCPSDEPTFKGRYMGKTHAITSYMMNGAVSGYGTKMPPWQVERMPPNGIIYWEVGTGSWNDGSSTPSEDITRRHKDGAVVSCFGGSAIWMTYDDYYLEESRLPGRLWCNPGVPNGVR